jgi:hypothetical protein
MVNTTIPKYTGTKDDRDYSFLRQKGLSYIESMASKLWTDYNAHDPGVTILEALCYAITDLGYRISRPIPDLIAQTPDSSIKLEDTFPSARQIFTTKAIAENDYRKLFIDIPGVKNAFIRPEENAVVYTHCSLKDEVSESDPKGKLSYEEDLSPHYQNKSKFLLRGINNIFFELDTDLQQLKKDDPFRIRKSNEIIQSITEKYHANRNLCEDLDEVKEVGEFNFQVCGDIEIEKTADALTTVVEVLFAIQQHVSPTVKRYTLEELLEAKKTTDEIFNGPVLENGFITDDELAKANFKTEIRLSDIVQIIAETPGVSRIKKLSMYSCPCDGESEVEDDCNPPVNPWKICFDKGFDKVIKLCLDQSILNIFKDVIPINIDQEKVKIELKKKFEKHNRDLELTYDDLETEPGTYNDFGNYQSVQNDLPAIYGTNETGLSPDLPEERHAQALQLKAWLTFFDQILATYFSHLKNVSQLFSADLHGGNSYYLNELTGIKDLDKLLKDKSNYRDNASMILGELEDFTERKGRFLDHLLSRFAENMNEYMFLMIDLFGVEKREASLWHKAKLLEEYKTLSYNRGKAFNYHGLSPGVWGTMNVSGLQHRLARLLGIRDFSRRDLTKNFFEIYPESDADPTNDWHWKLQFEDNSELLDSEDKYSTKEEAMDALWKNLYLAWDESNYVLSSNASGTKWTFTLMDNSREVLAHHPQEYTDRNTAKSKIKQYAKFIFDKVTDEGIYLFENILLRPDEGDPNATDKFMDICMDSDCKQCKPQDPYSFRLTIVLPGWTKRFSNMYFRQFAENAIRAEVPAHILSRICWIGSLPEDLDDGEENQMAQLEGLYHKWLQKKMESPNNQQNNEHLKPLVDLIHELDTIYPQGTLHDCNEEGEGESSIILNRSSLGELKK